MSEALAIDKCSKMLKLCVFKKLTTELNHE
jgi:hypothetical protein